MMKQTKAKAISTKTKKRVWDRDGGGCIICGNPNADPSCHYIRRSQGGLGIEQNIVTLCQTHHRLLDSPNTPIERSLYRRMVKDHLDRHYPDFQDEKRVYRK